MLGQALVAAGIDRRDFVVRVNNRKVLNGVLEAAGILDPADPETAVDEVLQEVRVAALAQRSPLRDADRIAPWLYRLAVLQSLVYRRGRGRSRKLAAGYAMRAEHAGREPLDPLDWLMADERRQLVREALAELPRRDTEILLLKYTENWSYHEIAAHLGTSHSAVEARLHRARTRLRERLAATCAIET